MISSIGSSPAYDSNSTAKPKTGLDAQIARHKKELSDCINCESAKTTKGKAKIQAISDKIAALTAQAEKLAEPKGANQPQINSLVRAGQEYNTATVLDSGFGAIGNNLNVFV